MQEYPIRERISLPVTRLGVRHNDWKWVLILSLVGFVLPLVTNIWIGNLPLFPVSGLLTLVLTVAFFNIANSGKRPLWFRHKLLWLVSSDTERGLPPAEDADESWVHEEGETRHSQATSQ